jgi:hypothetical protein
MRARAGILLLALSACAVGDPAAPEAPPVTAAAQPAPAPTPVARPARRAEAVWRVAQDGTTGCADRAALRILREDTGGDPAALRRLAAARATGGCVTVFRATGWRLVEPGSDAVRLAPVAPDGAAGPRPPGPLWFWRDQVAEERAAGA